jgi:hypothetical protein
MRGRRALEDAKVNIEHNATDNETGFQGFIDSEGWQFLEVSDPAGNVVLRFEGVGNAADLGLTELFFETVEPENVDVPIADMLAKMPEGEYRIAGPTMENGVGGDETAGTALFTHVIPAGPVLLEPSEGALVAVASLTMRWSPVTTSLSGGTVFAGLAAVDHSNTQLQRPAQDAAQRFAVATAAAATAAVASVGLGVGALLVWPGD